MAKNTKSNIADFEKSVERLNEIVQKMEKGDLPLEKSFEYFEEGVALIRACQKTLSEVEQKVEILMKEQGKEILKPYSIDSNDE